jgi:hypothetical protein
MISSHLLSHVVSFVEIYTGTTDIHAQSLCEEQFYRKRRRRFWIKFYYVTVLHSRTIRRTVNKL